MKNNQKPQLHGLKVHVGWAVNGLVVKEKQNNV